MKLVCPYCGAPALDVTTHSDREMRFMCTGHEHHRYTEEFEQFAAQKQREQLIVLP